MSSKIAKDKYYPIRKYKSYLYRQTQLYPCSFCQKKFLPKCYEKHCSSMHSLNPRLQCVWCRGKTHWPAKSRHLYGPHLLECAQKFMTHTEIPMIEKDPSYTLFDIQPVIPAKHFFGHKKISYSKDRAYDSIWPLTLNVSNLYQSDPINRAVAAMQKYLQIYKEMDIFHVMVRGVALQSFIDALDADHGQTQTFDFFCWCNGGRQPNEYYRQHRHMLVVSPKSHFKPNSWDSVKPSSKPPSNYTCKVLKRIKSPIHFANALHYVSSCKSRCAFSFSRHSDSNMNHYCISSPLPAQILIVLILQYEGGVIDWMKQTHQNMSEKCLISAPVKNIKGKWYLSVADTPNIPTNLILPIAKDFVPVQHVTPYFIYLNSNNKMYFEQLEAPLTDQEWVKRHIAGGNQFFQAVAHETWPLRPRYQRFLNATQPMMDSKNLEIAKQKTEINALTVQLSQLRVEMSQPKTETDLLKNKMDQRIVKNSDGIQKIMMMKFEINELKEQIKQIKEGLSQFKTEVIQMIQQKEKTISIILKGV